MNLLLLDQFSEPGGAQQCLLDLLTGVRREGWNALVGLPGTGDMFRRVRGLGFACEQVTCGPYTAGRKSAADVARFVAGAPLLARQIRHLADKVRADAIYLNGPRLLPAAALSRPRTPVLFHSHSLVPAGGMRELAGWSLRRLHATVIGSCRFTANPWRAFVAADRLSVIYNGVAGPPPDTAERRRTGPPVVGYIGRIAPEKGLIAFLNAARFILRVIPECRFAVHGAAIFGESDYEAEVRFAAAGLPVQFAGWTSNVYDALSGVDVLLVPSTAQEATTRVILEAFAAGVPVVAFGSGGIPEVITTGHDGFLAGSVEEMAQQAVECLRERGSALAAHARETWRTRFTLERYQSEVSNAVRKLTCS